MRLGLMWMWRLCPMSTGLMWKVPLPNKAWVDEDKGELMYVYVNL